MRDFLDLFQMIAECERKSRSVSASFQKGARMPVFPDEIDLYNFFERFDSHAIGKYHDFYAKYVAGRDLLAVFNIVDYLKERPNFVNITYWLGEHRYYAIRFKKRGVFLVSEKKYKELKTRKGCTV